MSDFGQGKPPFLTICLLLLILAVAAVPRFYGLQEAGPFVADECDYYLESQFIHTGLVALLDSFQLFLEQRRTGEDLWKREEQLRFIEENTLGKSPWRARVGHNYLLVLGMALGKQGYNVGNYVSAVFGLLSVLLVFFLGRTLYDTGTGLLASALLAVSGFDVVYSRSALLEIDLNFFLLLATLFYVRSWRAAGGRALLWSCLASLALGMSFLIVYRALVPLLVFWLFEARLAVSRRGNGENPWVPRALALALPMFFLLLLAELPYYLGFLACKMLSIVPPFMTYFQQVLASVVFVGGYCLASTKKVSEWANFLSFPYLFWKMNGPLVTLTCFMACGYALWKRSRADLFLAGLFLFPLLLFSVVQPRARYGSFAVCVGVLLAARFLREILAGRRTRKTVFLVIPWVLLLIAEGLWHSGKAVQAPPGYRQAMEYMRSNKGIRHVSSYPVASAAYAGSEHVLPTWPESEAELHALYEDGYHYVLMDFVEVALDRFTYLVPEGPKKERLTRSREVMARIKETMDPVFVCPNPPVAYLHNIFEVNHNFSMSMEFCRGILEHAEVLMPIRVYDVGDYFARRPFTRDSGPTEGSTAEPP
jgi:hypothetical protein